MPTIPSPFSAFLEEKVGAKQNLKQLEHRTKTYRETVKSNAGTTKTFDKRIGELKKENKPDSSDIENSCSGEEYSK